MSNYIENLAQDICADLPVCDSYIADIMGALTCTPIGKLDENGWPRAGGRLQFQFWGDPCPGTINPSLSIWIVGSPQLAWCSEIPNENEERNPNEWVSGISYFASRTSNYGTAVSYRAYAKLTVPDKESINVTLTIDALTQVNGKNQWANWLTVSNNMKRQGPYEKIGGMAYKSDPEYIPVSPSLSGGQGNIKYISMIAGIQPLVDSCSGTSYQTCGMYDGQNMKFCFRTLVEDKTNVLFPAAGMCGQNSIPCGGGTFPSYETYCLCDKCESNTCENNKDPQFKTDYIYTNFNEPTDVPIQVQICRVNNLEVMVKFFNNTLYAYYKQSTSTDWSRQVMTKVQEYGPTIWRVEDSRWRITFYNTVYPSPEILPICDPTTPTPNNTLPQQTNPFSNFNNMSIEDKRKLLNNKRSCGCNKS